MIESPEELSEARRVEIERLRDLLIMARIDLDAARTFVQHHMRSPALGLNQSIAKIDAALLNQQQGREKS